jgi:hypothetical protein
MILVDDLDPFTVREINRLTRGRRFREQIYGDVVDREVVTEDMWDDGVLEVYRRQALEIDA